MQRKLYRMSKFKLLMTSEIQITSDIPDVCKNCIKKDMEALYCLVFPALSDKVASGVKCFRVDVDTKNISGGRYNYTKGSRHRIRVK